MLVSAPAGPQSRAAAGPVLRSSPTSFGPARGASGAPFPADQQRGPGGLGSRRHRAARTRRSAWHQPMRALSERRPL